LKKRFGLEKAVKGSIKRSRNREDTIISRGPKPLEKAHCRGGEKEMERRHVANGKGFVKKGHHMNKKRGTEKLNEELPIGKMLVGGEGSHPEGKNFTGGGVKG